MFTVEVFNYVNKAGEEKEVSLLKLKEDDKYIEGLNIVLLEKEEVKELFDLIKKYKDISKFAEEHLDKYKKIYRKYIKENVKKRV